MSVVLLLAALAILGGVVVVAVGRGGELTIFRPDSLPFPREFTSAADVASFRPPTSFLGYSANETDDALRRIVRVVAERDAELARLRAEIAVLRGATGLPGQPAPGAAEYQGEPDWAAPGAPGPGEREPAEGWASPEGPAGMDAWRQGGGWGEDQEYGEHADTSPARDWSQAGGTGPSADWGGGDERAAETAWDDSAGWDESEGRGDYGQSELGWDESGGDAGAAEHGGYGPAESSWAESGENAEPAGDSDEGHGDGGDGDGGHRDGGHSDRRERP